MKITEDELKELDFLSTWIDSEDKDTDYDNVCIKLLRLNHNRILYGNLSKRKNLPKLEYEVTKIVRYKKQIINDALNKKTILFEKEIVQTIYPVVEEFKKNENEILEKGKRPDHDQLPEEIKAIYNGQREIYYKMSNCHTEAKNRNNQPPCERYPWIKELKDLKGKLDENWQTYDSYTLPLVTTPSVMSPVPGQDLQETAPGTTSMMPGQNIQEAVPSVTSPVPEQDLQEAAPDTTSTMPVQNIQESVPVITSAVLEQNPQEAVVINANRISANRKYISKNKSKLSALKETDAEKYKVLFDKIQERISELRNADIGMDDTLIEELKTLGFNTEKMLDETY